LNKKTNLFIVGAPKSGTTSFAELISSTTLVFSPKNIKEPAFFCQDKRIDSYNLNSGLKFFFPIETVEQYESLYADSRNEKYLLDASVDYFDSKVAASKIRQYNSDAKIIIILREYNEYLISLYKEMVKSAGEIPNGFNKNAHLGPLERNNLPKNLRSLMDIDYKERLKFSKMIDRYYDNFDPKNILILNFHQLINHNQDEEKKINDFLDIEINLENLPHSNNALNINNIFTFKIIYFLRKFKISKLFPTNLKQYVKNIFFYLSSSNSEDYKYVFNNNLLKVIEEDRKILEKKYGFSFKFQEISKKK